VRPKLQGLPSDYFKAQGLATFQEDPVGLYLAERFGLADNFAWANDYPHHEGTWPHSAEAIERTMSHLTDVQRAKILGLNAARFFKLEIPPHRRRAA
jgi:predicted TIM-barrel fold metal-dependent hydrolase